LKQSHEIYDDAGETRQLIQMYAELEFCEKGELFDLVQKHKGLPQEIAVYMFRQVLEGVSFLHQQGVYHRDLKLENIFLSDSWHPKIGDFGFATRKTQCSSKLGTILYIAPEM